MDPLLSISPVDGRYKYKLQDLSDYFSEFALIKKRLYVEILYLIELKKADKKLLEIHHRFDVKEARVVKRIEKTTNHDVKAIEYYLRKKTDNKIWPHIHYGLTSEDINNLSYNLLIQEYLNNSLFTQIDNLLELLHKLSLRHKSLPILARTHGQPASPTTFGKECYVFFSRLKTQFNSLKSIKLRGKLNGATGNYNALYFADPTVVWPNFSIRFIKKLGLVPNLITTQIEPRDTLVEVFQVIKRMNNIVQGLNNDMWLYIMLDYLKIKRKGGEVGSSTMPHKINPIDFENSEGNIKIANSLLTSLESLQISRFQRDLSDSTVMRNIGVAFAHCNLAYNSTLRGLTKIKPNRKVIKEDLDKHLEVLTEAIQTVLRKNGHSNAYEITKEFFQGKKVAKESYEQFISELDVKESIKKRLRNLSPQTYTGLAEKLVANNL